MKKTSSIIPVLVTLLLSPCCQREGLYKKEPGYVIRFDVDTSAVRYIKRNEFERIQLNLYDAETGKEVYKTYFGEIGGYLHSVHPGIYKIAAWTLNSDNTSVTYTNRFDLLTAESKTIREMPERIIAAPDRVFAYSSNRMEIPDITGSDKDTVFRLPLKSLIDSWRIEVYDVEGLENFSEAEFYIQNQVLEVYLDGWRQMGEAVVKASGIVSGGIVASEFGTFGMPGNDRIRVTVRIFAQNGHIHETTKDITDFMNDNDGHIIRLHFKTRLNPPEQGGLLPTTEEWKENTEIINPI